MLTKTDGKFKFTVPATSPVESERGKKYDKTFDYKVCETEAEAQTVAAEKKWSFVSLVNDNLYANAKANAYQTALSPHKVSQVSEESTIESLVRGYIRMGIPESQAREMVTATLASLK